MSGRGDKLFLQVRFRNQVNGAGVRVDDFDAPKNGVYFPVPGKGRGELGRKGERLKEGTELW